MELKSSLVIVKGLEPGLLGELFPVAPQESVFIPPLSSTLHCPAAAVVRDWKQHASFIFLIIKSPSPAPNEANQSRTPGSKGVKKEMRDS